MGTRAGDMDPAIILHVMAKEELAPHEMNTMLNKHSGFTGISGLSSDAREIEENVTSSDRVRLAADVFSYRIKKYVGAYMAALNGADSIIFTGGIGENSAFFRTKILSELNYLGIELDEKRNLSPDKEKKISSDTSRVEVWVIPTNEELVIARDTNYIVKEDLGEL